MPLSCKPSQNADLPPSLDDLPRGTSTSHPPWTISTITRSVSSYGCAASSPPPIPCTACPSGRAIPCAAGELQLLLPRAAGVRVARRAPAPAVPNPSRRRTNLLCRTPCDIALLHGAAPLLPSPIRGLAPPASSREIAHFSASAASRLWQQKRWTDPRDPIFSAAACYSSRGDAPVRQRVRSPSSSSPCASCSLIYLTPNPQGAQIDPRVPYENVSHSNFLFACRSKILREEDLNYLYFIWTMVDVIYGWILCVCPKLSKSAAYYVFAPS